MSQSETTTNHHRDWGFLEGIYLRSVRASAEAIFPLNQQGVPDWKETDLEARMVRYVNGLPPPQRRLLKLMFIGVEFLAVILSPGIRPFSRRPLRRRTANIAAWRASNLTPVRLFGDALKSALQMIYLSHPAVVRYSGEFKVWRNPGDAWEVEIREPAREVSS